MEANEIIHQRLTTQGLLYPSFKSAGELTEFMGAIQAQDYNTTKWGIGLRIPGSTDEKIESEMEKGKILRTHVMRPTWHFVSPKDILWMQDLTAERVHKINNYYYRKTNMHDSIPAKAEKIIEKALKGERFLTRQELLAEFRKAGIKTEGKINVGAHLMAYSELNGLVCSGPRKGKQFTYALVEERAPQAKKWSKEKALKELTKRFFTSHGPAKMEDFTWWSGLKVTDARKGIEELKSQIKEEELDGKTLYYVHKRNEKKVTPTIFLLSVFDEYLISYKDRDVYFYPGVKKNSFSFTMGVGILNGKIIGEWKKALKKNEIELELKFGKSLSDEEMEALHSHLDRMGEFYSLPVKIKK